MAILITIQKNAEQKRIVTRRYAKGATVKNSTVSVEWMFGESRNRTEEISSDSFIISMRETGIIDKSVEYDHRGKQNDITE